MRGIEGALFATQSAREGRFIGETLRSLGDNAGDNKGGKMPVTELSLASSLAYGALRREALWKKIFGAYVNLTPNAKNTKSSRQPREIDPVVSDCLLLGTAGLLELRNFAPGALVNGLLEVLKTRGHSRAVPMVNAVLHKVAADGPDALEKFRRSQRLEDKAVWAGIPEWTLPAWKKSWNNEDLNEILTYTQLQPCASLRTPPHKRDEVMAVLSAGGMAGAESDLFPDSIRLSSTVYPALVPGFDKGLTTVQTESSMLAASLVSVFWPKLGGTVLDMCSGRGVKAGQIAQALPDASLECWELSPGRHRAAAREMARLGIGNRVKLRLGDALSLPFSETLSEPLAKTGNKPSIVFLDAPCTGSGTWNRKPESKWSLSWAKVDKVGELQRALLRRALILAEAGGIIIYVTCSLLRQENENVVADALGEAPDCVVLDAPLSGPHTRRGRPWGTYILPSLPWLDGFYVSVIMKREGA